MSSTEIPFRYLSTAEVVQLALDTVGTVDGLDREALYLAVRRTAEGEPAEAHARIHEYAAALLEGLLSYHPFTRGNVDVAGRALRRFYELNGWRLHEDDAEVHQLVADMQTGRASVFAGAEVLARRAEYTR
ncbi:MAG: hypothetical protein M3394_03310 [Actinomycetota bacterium]|nr:hypothetical protein [Actinomycetota bacterium]